MRSFCLGIILQLLGAVAFAQPHPSLLGQLGAHHVFSDMQSQTNPSATPPTASVLWQADTFPSRYRQRPADSQHGIRIVWFKLEITPEIKKSLFATSDQDYFGVLVGRHLASLQLYLNDDFLGASGPAYGYTPRNWNQSFVWQVPRASLTANGTDVIYLRQYGYDQIGVMGPVFLGDYKRLASFVEDQGFWQISLSRAVWVLEIMMTVFCGFLWWRRRDPAYLYLALTALFASVAALYTFSQVLPIHQDSLLRFVHWCVDASVCTLVLFGRRLLQLPWTKLDWVFAVYPFGLILSHSLLPTPNLTVSLNLLHFVTLLMLLYLLAVSVYKGISQKMPVGWIFAVGILCMFLSFFHGVSLSLSKDIARWATEFHSGYLAMVPLLVMLLVYISKQFINSSYQLQAMNSELEKRRDMVRAELGAAHQKRLAQDRRAASNQARETAYRDLHDDLGARILSLVYSADLPERADLARSALQDLRDVVSRISTHETPLLEVFADCSFELNDRAARLDADVNWNDFHQPAFERHVDSKYGLYLKQFFRELFGAVIRQTGAKSMAIAVDIVEDTLIVSVKSDALDVYAQDACLSSHLLLRLRKLSGSLMKKSLSAFEMQFSLSLR